MKKDELVEKLKESGIVESYVSTETGKKYRPISILGLILVNPNNKDAEPKLQDVEYIQTFTYNGQNSSIMIKTALANYFVRDDQFVIVNDEITPHVILIS